jgi:hypothetical protein
MRVEIGVTAGLSLFCRATSAWLFRPASTSRTT